MNQSIIFEVISSNIEKFEYWPQSRTLITTFKHGGQYRYFNVPQETVEAVASAESVGAAFAIQIRNSFEFEKVYDGASL